MEPGEGGSFGAAASLTAVCCQYSTTAQLPGPLGSDETSHLSLTGQEPSQKKGEKSLYVNQ
jgi:hypothetical protein